MKGSLSGRELRSLLLILFASVIFFFAYLSLLTPMRRRGAELEQQVRSARDRLRILEAGTANETALHTQYQQMDQSVASLRSLLPSDEELPTVIQTLSDLASRAQVKIQTIFPQRQGGTSPESATMLAGPSASPAVYKEVLIQIDALAGYHQVGTFVSELEAAKKPMRIANLRISGNPKEPKRSHVKLLVRAYFATGTGGGNTKASLDRSTGTR